MKFYRCHHCHEISINLFNNNHKKSCCNHEMEEVKPNIYHDEIENHDIQVRKIGNFVTITIGKEEHPMLDIHYLSWVILQTNKGIQYKELNIGDAPIVDFLVAEDEVIINVFVNCSLHSIWSLNEL